MHALHYANELLVSVRQYKHRNVWKKSNGAYSLSIRVQTTINHISTIFFLYFIVFICKFYKEQVKRYYNASLNTFYIIKGYTHKKDKKTEGGKEAYCILNSYLHSISQKEKLD